MANDSLVTVSLLSRNNEKIKEELATKVDKTELENYYTSDEVDEIVENLSTGDVDLSDYAKTDDVNTALESKADKTELFSGSYNDLTDKPTIPSTDDLATTEYVDNAVSNVTVDTSNLVTDEELTNTLSNYTKTEDLPSEYDDTEVKELIANLADTKADKTELDVYVTDIELTDKGYATETFVTNKIAVAQLDGSDVDLTGLATKDELNAKADATHTHTLADITDYEAPDLSYYALKTEIPSTDGFVTEESLNTTLEDYAKSEDVVEYDDTSLVERINNVETSLEDKADTSDIPDVSNFVEKEEGKGLFSGKYEDLTGAPTIPSIEGLVSEDDLNTTLEDGYLSKSGGEIEGDLVVNTNTSIKETSYVISSEGSTVDIYNASDRGNNQCSGIVGGKNNKIVSSSSTIGAGIVCGENNQINANQNDHAVILGGRNNTIGGFNTSDTAIIAGQSNKITSTQTNSTIIGGTANTIKALGSNNAILGGSNNNITYSPDGCTIIGGSGNTINYTRSISTGVGGSIIGCDNTLASAEGVIVGWKNATSKSTRNIMIGYANGYTSSSVADTQGISVYIGADNHAESNYTKEQFIIGSHLSISTSATGIHTLMGSYNQETTESSPLIFGGGYVDENDSTVKQNLMRLTSEGQLYYKTGMGAGADYAEFFEWSDGNPNNEDRCGLFVTFDFDKQYDYDNTQELPHIRIANEGEYILGVISGNPSFIGNSDENWKKRFLQDDFGRNILKEVQVPITELQEIETGEYRTEIEYDENDNEIEVQVPITELKEIETGEYRTEYRNVLNPEYDETKEYESRSSRKEWDASGMLGVLSVRDDGTCEVGKFCKCGANGIATLADERGIDTFLVLRRVSDNVIKIVFK